MGLPGGVIGKAFRRSLGQALDQGASQGRAALVVQGRRVDEVATIAGAQQIEEVQAALGRARGEPGEAVVADLRAVAVPAAMARAGVVGADPRSIPQAGAQHCPALGEAAVLAPAQQAHRLALRNGQAQRLQLRGDALRSSSEHHLAIWRQPAFPKIADRLGTQHQALHHEVLIAFVARAGEHLRLYHPVLNDHPRRQLRPAAAPQRTATRQAIALQSQ